MLLHNGHTFPCCNHVPKHEKWKLSWLQGRVVARVEMRSKQMTQSSGVVMFMAFDGYVRDDGDDMGVEAISLRGVKELGEEEESVG